jgi:hypothetical protein
LDHWLETHSYFGAQLLHGLHRLYKVVLKPDDHPSRMHKQSSERRWVREGLEELRRIHNLTNENRIPLVVMLISSFDSANRVSDEEESTNDLVRAWCQTEHIPTFDPTRVLGRSKSSVRLSSNDHHWSPSANAIVGEELAQYLVNQHLIDRLAK